MLRKLLNYIRKILLGNEKGEISAEVNPEGDYVIGGIRYSVESVFQPEEKENLTLFERMGRIITNEYSRLTRENTGDIMGSNCICLTAEKEDLNAVE